MFKKLSMLVVLFILTLGLVANTASAETADSSTKDVDKYKDELANLSEEEVSEKFSEIDERYDMEEEFSKKDQAFIEMYAKPVEEDGSHNITPFKSENVSGSKTVNGITVKVNGTVNINVQGIINQSFGASNLKTRTTAGGSKVKSVTTKVNHNAYGLVGSGGVGKVYSGSITGTGKNHTLNTTKKYTGNVAYGKTWTETTVNYNGGTFTVP